MGQATSSTSERYSKATRHWPRASLFGVQTLDQVGTCSYPLASRRISRTAVSDRNGHQGHRIRLFSGSWGQKGYAGTLPVGSWQFWSSTHGRKFGNKDQSRQAHRGSVPVARGSPPATSHNPAWRCLRVGLAERQRTGGPFADPALTKTDVVSIQYVRPVLTRRWVGDSLPRLFRVPDLW